MLTKVNPPKFARLILLLIGLFIIFLASGCYTQKRAKKQVAKVQALHPGVLMNSCSLFYPPKIHDSIITEYIQGETEYFFDTIKVNCDSVVKANRNGNNLAVSNIIDKYIKVPKLRVDTLYDHQYHTIENPAKIEELKGLLESALTINKKCLINAKEIDLKRILWTKIGISLLIYLIMKIALRIIFPKFNFIISKLP